MMGPKDIWDPSQKEGRVVFDTEELHSKRSAISFLLFAGLLGPNILWLSPAPLLTAIMEDLNIKLTQAGLAISIGCLVIAFMGLISGYLVRKLSSSTTFLIGLWFMGLGASLTYLAHNYSLLIITRVFIGIGFSLCMSVSGSIIMTLFQERERPYLNTVNSLLPYVATVITFFFTPSLYHIFGENWRTPITTFGLGLIAAFWSLSGRSVTKEDQAAHIAHEKLLFTMIKNREVILLSIAEACDMWAFQFLTSLPAYLLHP